MSSYQKEIIDSICDAAVVVSFTIGYALAGKKMFGMTKPGTKMDFEDGLKLTGYVAAGMMTKSKAGYHLVLFLNKMATIAAMAGGAALNAAAFSGTNYIFSKLSDHGAEERKRHDKATEELQKAQAAWTRERQERLDFINERLRQEQHAEKELNSLDDAMADYYEATS